MQSLKARISHKLVGGRSSLSKASLPQAASRNDAEGVLEVRWNAA